MAALYADENFDARVVTELRQRGHDVRTVQEAGRRGRDDPSVLADATAEGRAVLTCNRRHFLRLHRQSTAHAGIIVCTPDPDVVALAVRIDQAIVAAGSLVGQCLRVNRPP
jgi:predicted nuclease of predicted toxin-antitoxin system